MTKDQETNLAHASSTLMSGRTRFVLWFDSILLAGFLLLLSPRVTGLGIHELIGITFSILLIVHLLIAWPWIQTTTKSMFSQANPRTRLNYLLNTALFISVVLELVSGLVISQVVLPFAGPITINDRSWRALHNLAVNWTMLAAGLNMAINWERILSALGRHVTSRDRVRENHLRIAPSVGFGMRRIGLMFLAVSIVAAGAYAALGQPATARLYKMP